MVWGTGQSLIEGIVHHIERHPHRKNLEIRFRQAVRSLEFQGGRVTGCHGLDGGSNTDFTVVAENVVVAAGGISGSLKRIRENWYKPWGHPPEKMLNGSHRYADGTLHDAARLAGAQVTHLDRQWNYAAGVHHPYPNKPDHGLSLVPPKSALWVDATGRRFGPVPLVTAFDTRFLVEQVCLSSDQYSWQILNRKIAIKELAVSGSEFNEAIRDKKLVAFLATLLLGNRALYKTLTEKCPDFIVADTLEALVENMNALDTNGTKVSLETLRESVQQYDGMIGRGKKFFNDDQLRRIAQVRQYFGDRARTCKFQKILDPKAGPLVAIREFILTRKSLGGIQTDLQSRALNSLGEAIPGLYAAGEAAGFGGGGIHGLRALEGTFLGACILTGQAAARSLVGKGGRL
jgi:predicted oxidoreductase